MPISKQKAANELGVKFELAYGVGSVGTAIFVIAPQILLLYFMTEALGIPPAAAGLALLFPKLVEFFTDPLIGRWSDRIQSRWGRRRPFMAVGTVFFLVGFIALFSPPDFSHWHGSLMWVLILYTLTTTAYTFFEVPYITMLSEVTDDAQVRTRVSGWRSVFLSVGFMLAGGLAPWIVQSGGADKAAFATMGLLVGLMSFAAMATTVLGTGSGRVIQRSTQSSGQLLLPLRVPAFAWLWLGFIIQMISVSVNSALLTYYNKYWLGNNDLTISKIFLGVMTLTVLTTVLWTKLARGIGKYRGFYIATVFYALGMALFWFAKDSTLGFWLAVTVLGIANAGQQLFCFAIVPDVIAAERQRSGFAEEGAFTGIWVMGQKLGLALGAGIAGLGLHLFGFVESLAGTFTEQSDSAMFAIVLFVSVVPGIICLLSLYPIYKSKQSFNS